MHERTIGIGHNQSPVSRLIPGQPWPKDAQAGIRCRQQPLTTAGRASARQWVLFFPRRSAPEIEPLMGWMAGDDPLAQLELTFETKEAAIAYAEREGLAYRVQGEPVAATPAQRREAHEQSVAESAVGTIVWLSWLHSRYGRCDAPGLPDLDQAFINPAATFSSPDAVVRHPLLTVDCKREILWRWAWDEYLLDLADADGMPEGEPSRLPEVKAALRLLNSEWSPDPAAPAAYVVRYDRQDLSLAA
jgi:ETC complex I subunit conserved region